MDIPQELYDFVDQNCEYDGAILEYDYYIKCEMNTAPLLNGESRKIEGLVSVTGWNTSNDGFMCLAYTPLLENRSHAVKLNFIHNTHTGLHTHNYIELAYVVRGRLVQNIVGKIVTFSEGEICLIDSKSLHEEILLWEDSTILCLSIDNTFFDHLLQKDKSVSRNLRYIKKLIAHKKSEYSFVRFAPKEKGVKTLHTFATIFDELLYSQPCKTVIVKGFVERLVHLLSSEYKIVLSKKERNELGKELFRDIEEYIEQNYRTATVQKLGDLFNYNPDYLSRLCTKKTGMNLSQYIQKIRIEKALAILETTTLSVDQVARDVGYNNVGFFYKKFKEQYHTTPDKIRHK